MKSKRNNSHTFTNYYQHEHKKHKTYIPQKTSSIMKRKKGVQGWLIWSIIFLLIALVAGFFGFGFISGISYVIAKWLAIIFIILFAITIIARTIKRA